LQLKLGGSVCSLTFTHALLYFVFIAIPPSHYYNSVLPQSLIILAKALSLGLASL